MGVVLGFSGEKQSGKNTCCNMAVGAMLAGLDVIKTDEEGQGWMINPKDGSLWVSNIYGNKSAAGILDMMNDDPKAQDFLYRHIYPYVKIYAYADLLKETLINIFNIDRKKIYGTDADKNELTPYKWEDMPGVVTTKFEDKWGNTLDDYNLIYHKPGHMTIRELMQFFGTDICRKMYENVWVEGLLRRIVAEDPLVALVCDIRFPGEIDGVKSIGGKVVRLTKTNPDKGTHKSETVLDKKNYDWSNFDYVMNNEEMNFLEQGNAVTNLLTELGVLENEYDAAKK